MLFFACLASLCASADPVNVSTTKAITTGSINVDENQAGVINFLQAKGWLVINSDAVDLAINMGIRNDTQGWTWSFLRRGNCTVVTGDSKLAQVQIYPTEATTLKYAAGYVGTGDNICSSVAVSTNFNQQAAASQCFVDGLLRESVKSDVAAEGYSNEGATTNPTQTPSWAVRATGAATITSQDGNEEMVVGDVKMKELWTPVEVTEDKNVLFMKGSCTSYESCNFQLVYNWPKSGLTVGAIIGIVIGCVGGVVFIAVMAPVVVKSCKKCRSRTTFQHSSSHGNYDAAAAFPMPANPEPPVDPAPSGNQYDQNQPAANPCDQAEPAANPYDQAEPAANPYDQADPGANPYDQAEPGANPYDEGERPYWEQGQYR